MPHSDIHKKKLKTNLAIIGLIAAFCVLIFGITIVKMALDPIQGGEVPAHTTQQDASSATALPSEEASQ